MHGELSGTLPIEREQTLVAVSPPLQIDGECTFHCIHGGGGKVSPQPQCCSWPAHEKATLPLSCCPCWGCRHCNCCCHLRCRCQLHCHCCLCRPSPLPSAIAVAVSVNHHRRCLCCIAISHRHCHRPCRWSLPSPSLPAKAVAISVCQHCCHCRWPFQSVVALA
jgi:hypothetical protein